MSGNNESAGIAGPATDWSREVEQGERFQFGRNWSFFLRRLDDRRIELAERSLREMLQVDRLDGRRFLDVGSGSGLFSLAARRLGAEVHSFDFDPQSVACTRELRRLFFSEDDGWTVSQGSVLDTDFLAELGRFDIVYSWGVLHHTGRMWDALENVAPLVADGGQLFIAIYNDQGLASRGWRAIKKAYVSLPESLRWLVVGPAVMRMWGPATVRDFIQLRPFHSWRTYEQRSHRGMDAWRDTLDWIGGYPFEVASREAIIDFYVSRGFSLDRLASVGWRLGCNEFVFRRGG